ncbi:uncharacterized protein PGTG_22787, partial [Puccinia graminis f. sp. tritici CRL 75-36-700-3]
PILALFEGKINSNANDRVREDRGLSGACVDFTYTVLDLCIVVVAQSKLEDPKDDAAQLMFELKGAQQSNKLKGFPLRTINGLLCSRDSWEIWSCDVNGDCSRSQPLPMTNHSKDVSLKNLGFLFEVVYHIFFEAYIGAIEALINRSEMHLPAKSHQWQASLHLGTDAFNMARVAKDNVQFHEAIKKLQESFDLLPDEHDRELGGYLEAFKSAISK